MRDAAAIAGTDPAGGYSCKLRSGVSPVAKSEGPGAPSVCFWGVEGRINPVGRSESIPQGLKPSFLFRGVYGTTEVVPFHFVPLLKQFVRRVGPGAEAPAPFVAFTARLKSCPFTSCFS
jgi:hypothetical protein